MNKRAVTEYTLSSPRISRSLTFAVVTDLHNGAYEDAVPYFRQADAILVAGDLLNRHVDRFERAAAFIREAPDYAPTFLSLGNHELRSDVFPRFRELLAQSRVVVLENRWVPFQGVALGGLSSTGSKRQAPHCAVLREMSAQSCFKLLMCHHPEYYEPYVSAFDIDLTLSGHAHGGQIVLGGQGLFAPGQGLFPKWTRGFYFGNRLLVSRGMTNTVSVPRFHNPCELLMLRLEAQK